MSSVRHSAKAKHPSLKPGIPENVAVKVSHEVVSAGSLIRCARETAGLRIAELAASLKVPAKKLEALEADRFDLLPDIVFTRALASSVCRHLKIDTIPVLERLPQINSSKLIQQSRGINTPFHASVDGFGHNAWSQVSKPAVLTGVVLLLGALVIIFLPTLKAHVDTGSVGVVPLAVNSRTRQPEPLEATPEIASVPRFLEPSVTVVDAPAPSAGAPAVTLPSLSESAQALPPATPSSSVINAAAGIVVFIAKSSSWVEVTDAKGAVVLRRTLSAGETVGASGALPLTAIVGKADTTQVKIRGEVFDLTALAKDNVARFEVK